MQIDFKKYKTDILIIAGLAIFSLLYCYPQLQGKKLKQSDIVNWQSMSHEAAAFHDSTGKDVLWSNSMFGGMPTYTYFIAATNTNYTSYLQSLLVLLGKPAYFFFTVLLCFYLLMQVLGINKWLSITGAVAFALSSYNSIIIAQGHDTKMMSIALLPAIFAGLFLIYRQKWWTGAALFSLAIALVFANSHFQIIYYTFIILFCFSLCMLFVAVKERKIREFIISTLIAIASIGIGIGPNLPVILSSLEYAKETIRGGSSELSGHDVKRNGGLDKEYAFNWSSGIGETLCMMIPYLYGGSSNEAPDKAPKTIAAIGGSVQSLPIYWGEQPFIAGPTYFGAVVCFLFLLGMRVVRSPHKWWILASCIIGIILSWGKNFETVNYFLFDHIPMLNKFRTVTMALIIPQFLFPMLGIWAIQEVINQKNNPEKLLKDVMWATVITVSLCLLIGQFGRLFFSFTGSGDADMKSAILELLKEDRATLAKYSGFKSAFYILISCGILVAFIKDKIKMPLLITGIALIIVIDLAPVATSYLNSNNYVEASDYDALFTPGELDKIILKDPDPYYRVLVLNDKTYHSAVQAYFHKCIGGYHAAKLEIYQDLIDRQLGDNYNIQVVNMLNTKYAIVGTADEILNLKLNMGACGNAWFVEDVKWADNAEEEMNGLNAAHINDTGIIKNAFRPKKTAIMRSVYKQGMGRSVFEKDTSAFIKLDKYGLDDISFVSGNSRDGLGIFSDIYYAKGWKAYIDGKETPIMKADYVLRALKIPAGNHHIEFHFRPASFYYAGWIALPCSILIISLCIMAFYKKIHKNASVQ